MALDVGVVNEPALRDMTVGDLELPLVCWEVAQMGGKDPCPFSQPSPSMEGMRGGGPGVMSVGELVMTLTCCNTWERWSCTSPGQQDKAGPGSRGCQ